MNQQERHLLQLEHNAIALRNMANVVLAGVEKMRASTSTQPVTAPKTKKVTRGTVRREMALTTQLISKAGRKKK